MSLIVVSQVLIRFGKSVMNHIPSHREDGVRMVYLQCYEYYELKVYLVEDLVEDLMTKAPSIIPPLSIRKYSVTKNGFLR